MGRKEQDGKGKDNFRWKKDKHVVWVGDLQKEAAKHCKIRPEKKKAEGM